MKNENERNRKSLCNNPEKVCTLGDDIQLR